MTHGAQNKPPIDRVTAERLARIGTEANGIHEVKDFAVFVDTHRDQPHVGVFHEDIHRGQCRPTPVDYLIEDDLLVDKETGLTLPRHEKHLFVTNDYYGEFLTKAFMETGTDPRDGDGAMPTSHFRDARAKVYELKSFREIVRLRYEEERLTRKKP